MNTKTSVKPGVQAPGSPLSTNSDEPIDRETSHVRTVPPLLKKIIRSLDGDPGDFPHRNDHSAMFQVLCPYEGKDGSEVFESELEQYLGQVVSDVVKSYEIHRKRNANFINTVFQIWESTPEIRDELQRELGPFLGKFDSAVISGVKDWTAEETTPAAPKELSNDTHTKLLDIFELVSDPTKLGIELREMRDTAGLSQTDVADRMGVKPPTINRLEHGLGNPTWKTVAAYCAAVSGRNDAALAPRRAIHA